MAQTDTPPASLARRADPSSAGAIATLMVAVGLACAGAPGVAAAQSSSAAARLGLPDAAANSQTRRFDITLSAKALYDSNVARGAEAVAAARGLSRADVIYTTEAQVDAARQLGPVEAFLQGDVGYEAYQRDHTLNAPRYDLTGGLTGKVGRCEASVYDQYAHRQSDLRDVSVAVTRNIQSDNTVGAGVQCQPVSGVTSGLSGSAGVLRNTAATVPDADTSQASGFVGYVNHALGSLQLVGQYQRIRYVHTDRLLAQDTPPNVKIYSGGLAYERPIGARLHGRAEISYTEARAARDAAANFSGLSADVDLTYRPSHRLSAELTYARQISATLQAGSSYVLNNAVTLEGRYRATRRIAVALGGSWNRRRYPRDVDPAVFVGVSKDETNAVFGSITTKIGRQVDLGLDLTYETRTTDLPVFDYDDYRVGLSASTHF